MLFAPDKFEHVVLIIFERKCNRLVVKFKKIQIFTVALKNVSLNHHTFRIDVFILIKLRIYYYGSEAYVKMFTHRFLKHSLEHYFVF